MRSESIATAEVPRDSKTASFMALDDQLRKLHVLIVEVLAAGPITTRCLEKIEKKREHVGRNSSGVATDALHVRRDQEG